jgi:hypothetical protein
MDLSPQHNASPYAAALKRRRSRWMMGVGVLFLVMLVGAVVAVVWTAHNAEPIVKARVVQTLSERFHTPVELDELHLSVLNGLEVEGAGLRVLYISGPAQPYTRPTPAKPLLSIRAFQFHTGLRQLLEPTMRITTVKVQGAELHIPPRQNHGPRVRDSDERSGLSFPAEKIVVDKIVFTDLKVFVETTKPGKLPLDFEIANLTLGNVGARQPFAYDATLRNPKPVGDVHAVGHFGPWQSGTPRDTALDGSYSFTHADLSTIKGIGGTLSSEGQFTGTLGQIVVDGSSDTPDFRLATSGHTVPLHTDFHVIVDGTNGDTYLQPVNARLLHSYIVATGSVTRQRGVPGHDVELEIVMDRARIDDMLTLAVRTYPPVLRGSLALRAHLSIPQGTGTVTRRMHLQGTFNIEQGVFNNASLQQQIDNLSERAQGWPEKANKQQAAAITSTMKGDFSLADEQMVVPSMTYAMPGATVGVEGRYGLDGAALDFHGTVRTQATASEMVGGWQQLLVMPFDRLLKKNGAGLEIPFKLGGTQKDPKLALDFGRYGRGAGQSR